MFFNALPVVVLANASDNILIEIILHADYRGCELSYGGAGAKRSSNFC